MKVYVEIGIICHDVESYGDMLDAFSHVYRHVYRLDATVVCTSIYKVYNIGDIVRLVICRLISYHRARCEVTEICHLCHIVDAVLSHLEYSGRVGDVTGNSEI